MHALNATASCLESELTAIARASSWFMRALVAAQSLGLPSWCIGAGAVRNLVWDHLHGYTIPSALPDVDLAYFDPQEPPDCERGHQQALAARLPELPWEVTNQAHVHLWFEEHFGHAVAPLGSLSEAVASWPEYTTCVGIALLEDGTLTVIAPHGLEDLFALRVRRNPRRVSIAQYMARIATKRYRERWPGVTVIEA